MEKAEWMVMMEKMQEIRHFCGNYTHRYIEGAISSAQELDLLSRAELSGERLTPQRVCQDMGISKALGSRLIRQLIAKGLLEKENSECDRRSYYLVITSRGSEEVKQTYVRYLEPVYHLRRTLGEEKFSMLMGLIREANVKDNIKDT